jgi:hypothetical protein
MAAPGRGDTPRAALAGLDRRTFLAGSLALLVLPRALRAGTPELPEATRAALEGSEFVYVSPLLPDGSESTCHGEVWYGWLDGAVVLTTARGTWKARALERGLDRARLWAGSHGRWKRLLARNEAFRAAPSFDARVEAVQDPVLVERLLGLYTTKYPAEFPAWEQRMRGGHASGDRILLRYLPA